MLVDDVRKVGGDGVEDPGNNHAVHAGPRRVVEAGGVGKDVVLQREATEDEEDVAAPLGVVGRKSKTIGIRFLNDLNQIPDVLDSGGLWLCR